MILITIVTILVLLLAAMAWYTDGFRVALSVLFFTGLISSLMLFLVIAIGQNITAKRGEVTSAHRLLSLDDTIFVSSTRTKNTQNFSYYRKTDTGGFILEKQDASVVTIYPDATPETARVDITEYKRTCVPSWWVVCGDSTPVRALSHADFHIPPQSIKENYTLDAQ